MYVKNTQRSWSYCSVGCLIKRSCVKVSRQAHLWRRHQHRRCLCNPQDLESCGKTSKELHQKQAYIWGIPKNTTTLETRLENPGVRTRNGLLFEWNISTEESKNWEGNWKFRSSQPLLSTDWTTFLHQRCLIKQFLLLTFAIATHMVHSTAQGILCAAILENYAKQTTSCSKPLWWLAMKIIS